MRALFATIQLAVQSLDGMGGVTVSIIRYVIIQIA